MADASTPTAPRSAPIRVLIVTAWDPMSGVATVHRLLAERLAPRGVRYSAYAFDGWREDTWWAAFCDELIGGPQPTLSEVLMSGRYDLLHCGAGSYSPPYGVETWVRRARFRGPVVMTTHTTHRELSGPAHATRHVACSPEAAETLARDVGGDVVVIPNGFDEEVFRPGGAPPRDRPLLVWVGRSPDPTKDVGLFLDGLESLPDHDAVIVDTLIDSRDADVVRDRVRSLGSRVQHIGPLTQPELAELFRAAAASGGAFVCTSRYEGFLIAASEAIACACPAVVPRIHGVSHLVDTRNAIVFDRALGAVALVEAVGRSRDPDLRAAVVRQGLEDAAGWSSSVMAETYLRLYEGALAAVPSPTLVQRIADPVARSAWRLALRVRPLWLRLRRLLRGREARG